MDAAGELTGEDIAYIYPDLKMAIKGKFLNGVLVEGHQCELVGCYEVNQEPLMFSAVHLILIVSGEQYLHPCVWAGLWAVLRVRAALHQEHCPQPPPARPLRGSALRGGPTLWSQLLMDSCR
jgi:hypothetical protein